MSYRIRLCLTHIATAIIAGYCVWCGLQVRGFSQLAFMVLFGAGIIVPSTLAAWWLTRGVRQMETALSTVGTEAPGTGLSELDVTTARLRGSLSHQRELAEDVHALLHSLNRSVGAGFTGSSDSNHQLLTEALGQLSRRSSVRVGNIIALGDDIAREAHDSRWGAHEQVETITSAITAAEELA